MGKKLTTKEFNAIKKLVETQNMLVSIFQNNTKQVSEPQLRDAFQKMCASSKNHKRKLLKSLEVPDE